MIEVGEYISVKKLVLLNKGASLIGLPLEYKADWGKELWRGGTVCDVLAELSPFRYPGRAIYKTNKYNVFPDDKEHYTPSFTYELSKRYRRSWRAGLLIYDKGIDNYIALTQASVVRPLLPCPPAILIQLGVTTIWALNYL